MIFYGFMDVPEAEGPYPGYWGAFVLVGDYQ